MKANINEAIEMALKELTEDSEARIELLKIQRELSSPIDRRGVNIPEAFASNTMEANAYIKGYSDAFDVHC